MRKDTVTVDRYLLGLGNYAFRHPRGSLGCQGEIMPVPQDFMRPAGILQASSDFCKSAIGHLLFHSYSADGNYALTKFSEQLKRLINRMVSSKDNKGRQDVVSQSEYLSSELICAPSSELRPFGIANSETVDLYAKVAAISGARYPIRSVVTISTALKSQRLSPWSEPDTNLRNICSPLGQLTR